jgi:hypothetical protein
MRREKPVKKCLAQFQQCANFSNWFIENLVNIIKAKLCGEALQFVNGWEDLFRGYVTYETEALLGKSGEKLSSHSLLHEAIKFLKTYIMI